MTQYNIRKTTGPSQREVITFRTWIYNAKWYANTLGDIWFNKIWLNWLSKAHAVSMQNIFRETDEDV